MDKFPEKDWKIIRSMKDRLLDLACERILVKASNVIEQDDVRIYTKYIKLWELMKKEDKGIAAMFDEVKRSNAVLILALWRNNNLITDSEFDLFTPETRERVQSLIEIWKNTH